VLCILPDFEHDFGPLEAVCGGFYCTVGRHADGSALALEVEVGRAGCAGGVAVRGLLTGKGVWPQVKRVDLAQDHNFLLCMWLKCILPDHLLELATGCVGQFVNFPSHGGGLIYSELGCVQRAGH
jgi:hypothetical protein